MPHRRPSTLESSEGVRTQCVFSLIGQRAAKIGAGATLGVLATPAVLTAGLGILGFSAGGVVAGKFPSDPLVIQHPISRCFKAR